MPMRWRPMEPQDVAACAEIVAAHPVIGPRYGGAIQGLGRAWLRLLESEAMTTAVFEEIDRGRANLAGVGVGVFVRDEFIGELKTPPLCWIGPTLVERILTGDSPVLSDQEVRRSNSGAGLNELVWETLAAPAFSSRMEIYHLMGSAYLEIHRGFRFKEMITSQAESPERLQWALDAGGLYWDPKAGRYVKSPRSGAKRAVRKPHVVGVTRELEFERPGSWVGSLFDYHPPRCGFSASERRLLICTMTNRYPTSAALARQLGISLATVKKRWLSIYDRVAERVPELFDERATAGTKRGIEKKRRLLGYLQDHAEELRPTERLRTRHHARPGREVRRARVTADRRS